MSAHRIKGGRSQKLQEEFLRNGTFIDWQIDETALVNFYEEIWENSVSEAREVLISVIRSDGKSISNLPD